jgi:hypothetical protein
MYKLPWGYPRANAPARRNVADLFHARSHCQCDPQPRR